MHIVYQTTNLVNGTIYVGAHSTDRLDDGYLGSGKLIKQAVKKYGSPSFRREILFVARDDTYNLVVGGGCERWSPTTLGKVGQASGNRSSESIEKMRKSLIGRKLSPEHKAKCAASNTGKKRSPEALKNLSESHKGQVVSEGHREKLREANLGKKHSTESREKMSQAQTGRKHSKETRQKISTSRIKNGDCISPETRVRMAEARRGFQHTEESKRKMTASRMGKPRGKYMTKARLLELERQRESGAENG